MANESPVSVLFSRDGYDVVTTDGYSIVSGQPGIIAIGKDGSTARFIAVNASGAIKIDGSAVTQPISAASLPLPTGAATETTLSTRLSESVFTARINTLGQKTMANSTPVVISSDQSAITITGSTTVSGTVTSNQGTAAALANAWPILISDGTNTNPLTNAAPIGNEQALVVRNIPSGTQTISGAVTATVSGTVTANQGTSASLSNPWPVQLSNGTNTPIITNTTPGGSDQALVVRNIPSGTQAISAASLPLPTGAATDTTLSARLAESTFTARINTLGQKTMANSTPVVFASDQTVIPVSDNGGSLTIDNSALSVVGGGTETGALRVTIANNSTGVVSVDDNGSSLTIDNAALSVVGGGTQATALRVTIASDSTGVVSIDDNGGSLTVDGTVTANAGTGTFAVKEIRSSTTAVTSVAAAAANTTILASNANRLGATVYNDSNKDLYLKLGSVASTTSFTVKLVRDAYYEVPFHYTGIITGIWDTAPSGNARITELT